MEGHVSIVFHTRDYTPTFTSVFMLHYVKHVYYNVYYDLCYIIIYSMYIMCIVVYYVQDIIMSFVIFYSYNNISELCASCYIIQGQSQLLRLSQQHSLLRRSTVLCTPFSHFLQE